MRSTSTWGLKHGRGGIFRTARAASHAKTHTPSFFFVFVVHPCNVRGYPSSDKNCLQQTARDCLQRMHSRGSCN